MARTRTVVAGTVGVAALLTYIIVAGTFRTQPPGRRAAAYRLPERMRIENVTENLLATFDDATIVSEPSPQSVRIGGLQPGVAWDPKGRYRRAILAPPPSRIRFRLRVAPGALLRFGVGVARHRDGDRDPSSAGVRFTVTVDSREVFSHVLDATGPRSSRRWFDAAVDLGVNTTRTVEIALRTDGDAGTRPGWSHVRLVQETEQQRQQARANAPNVLILLVDTLRRDRLGCYGANPSPTPTLDALASRGVVFDQAVAQSSWTLPSVASIFTGVHPRSHGVVGKADKQGRRHATTDPSYLPDGLQTLAGLAQAAGITTFGVSTNPLVSEGTNLARGFETFLEFEWPRRDWPNADEVNALFLEWLRANRHHRFLGYLHYMDVHDPYQPPEPYRPPVPDGLRQSIRRGEIPDVQGAGGSRLDVAGGSRLDVAAGSRLEGAVSPADLSHLRRLYDAEIRYWDDQLAGVLDELSALGIEESTVLIITSDHGEEFLEHGGLKHRKTLYDELVHVPLIVVGPGFATERRTHAQGIDLLPTVAAILGIDPPGNLPGRNLFGTDPVQPAISETHWGRAHGGSYTEIISVRTEAWKLIHTPTAQRYELYDLTNDPGERHNRFDSEPAATSLRRHLEKWAETAPRPPKNAGSDPEFTDRLHALGYIE